MLNVGKLILIEVQLISQCNKMKYGHSAVSNPVDCSPQAPLSVGFSRQEDWSGLPCPSPGNLPHPGIEPRSPALAGGFFTTKTPGELVAIITYRIIFEIQCMAKPIQ